MSKKHGPNKENLEATRRLFLEIARREFSEKGYYNASTADIVEQSGMARGSLYYHFGDKKGLFRAVYLQLMHEMQAAIRASTAEAKSSWDALLAVGLKALDMSTDSRVRRIIVDVHTALTYSDRIDILSQTLLADLMQILKNVMQDGYFQGHDIRILSMMIFGMLSESSRSLELAQDVVQEREIIGNNYIAFMEKARA